jgi:hypothetical protein
MQNGWELSQHLKRVHSLNKDEATEECVATMRAGLKQ